MRNDIPESLQTFFVPQMEQMALTEVPSRHGSLSYVDDERGQGTLWALALGEHCLFTYHDIHAKEPFELREFPDDYLCLGSMTDAAVKYCPLGPCTYRKRNIVSFSQKAAEIEFLLRPEDSHHSFTLCMTPRFFENLSDFSDNEVDALVTYLATREPNTHPHDIARALESMGPALANQPGGAYFCEGKLREILALCLDDALREETDGEDESSAAPLGLAREACAYIDEHFSENLTAEGIARALFVGRTKLCESFREVCGVGVAEYLRERRMCEAARLLADPTLKMSAVARDVGYARQGSFTEAFHRHFGITPTQCRRRMN